jgi:hypothetical protein
MNTWIVASMGVLGITALIGIAAVITFHAELKSSLQAFRSRNIEAQEIGVYKEEEEDEYLLLQVEQEMTPAPSGI